VGPGRQGLSLSLSLSLSYGERAEQVGRQQLAHLIAEAGLGAGGAGSMLDIAAGSGSVTATVSAALGVPAQAVTTTEISGRECDDRSFFSAPQKALGGWGETDARGGASVARSDARAPREPRLQVGVPAGATPLTHYGCGGRRWD
jgi:hypothetical protein